MRYRHRDTPAVTMQIGSWMYKYNWEQNWSTIATYTNQNPGTAQAPYTTRESIWDVVHKKTGLYYLEGGPLEKWRSYVGTAVPVGSVSKTTTWGGDRQYWYKGAFVCSQPVDYFRQFFTWSPGYFENAPVIVTDGSSSWGDTSNYTARAWDKFKPGASVADASVFIGEIRDVPRMLKSTAQWFSREFISRFGKNPRGRMKVLADTWLNAQFGWRPFLGDLRNFYKAYVTMDEWYQQLVRENGRWVHRKGRVEKNIKKEVVYSSSSQHMSTPNFGGHPAWCPSGLRSNSLVTRFTSQRVWFEAQFRYYVPEIESVGFRRKAIAHLFGLDVNPAIIWELIPWSWLVDWFTNLGDLITNQSTGLLSNLTAKYAYLMGHRVERLQVTSFPNFFWMPQHVWTLELERKSRKEANNFGFGLSDRDLSARQWSILGALGISRLH